MFIWPYIQSTIENNKIIGVIGRKNDYEKNLIIIDNTSTNEIEFYSCNDQAMQHHINLHSNLYVDIVDNDRLGNEPPFVIKQTVDFPFRSYTAMNLEGASKILKTCPFKSSSININGIQLNHTSSLEQICFNRLIQIELKLYKEEHLEAKLLATQKPDSDVYYNNVLNELKTNLNTKDIKVIVENRVELYHLLTKSRYNSLMTDCLEHLALTDQIKS